MDQESNTGRNDPILLVEIVLLLLLLGLFLALYLIPAAVEPFLPEWWAGPLLGALFFGLIALDAWRRRRRSRAELRALLRESRDAEPR